MITQLFKNKAIKNSGLQFVERIVNSILTFISSLLIIRYLAPNDYGVFAYANSYVSLFSVLTTLGIASIVVRELVKQQIDQGEILGSSFCIMFIGSIIALIIATVGSILFNNKIVTWVIFIYCLNNLIAAFAVINFYFQAKIKTNLTAFAMLFQDVIDLFAKCTLVYFKAPLIYFPIQGLISVIILYSILYWLYKNETGKLIRWQTKFMTIKLIFKQSVPLAISTAIINIYMRVDQVMLEHYKGLHAVAEYSVGVKLTEVVYILPMILAPNLLPVLLKKHAASKVEFDEWFVKLMRIYILAALAINLIFFVGGPFIVKLLYGAKYTIAGNVLRWFSFCILPVFIGVISSLWLQVYYLQAKQLYQTVLGLLVCVVVNILLIPRFGVMGAVVAIILAQFTNVLSAGLFQDLQPLFKLYIKAIRL